MSGFTARLEQIVDRRERFRGTVIFVHGLDGDAFTTWGGDKHDPHFWPMWLKGDAPSLEVYSVGYDASALRGQKTGDLSLEELGIVVFEALKSAGPEVFDAPIAFVCHSLGGIVLKQVLRHAEQSSEDPYALGLLENVSRVFFVATPHSGSAIASRATKYLGFAVNRVVGSLEKGHAHTTELGDWYREFSALRSAHLKNRVYYETIETSLTATWFQRLGGIARTKVVEKESADPGLPGVKPIPLVGDHVTIAKPRSRQHLLYEGILRELNAMVASPRRQRRPATDIRDEPAPLSNGSRWLKIAAVAAGATAVFALTALGVGLVTTAPVASPTVQVERPETPAAPMMAKVEPQPVPQPAPQAKDAEIERQRLAEEEKRKFETERLRQQELAAQKAREDEERRVEAQKRRAEAEQREQMRREEEIKRAEAERLEREKQQALQKAEEEAKAVVRQAQAIQEGLRRAGCFRGPVSGLWGPLTKAAVARYNKHAAVSISADRPTQEAEAALLAIKGKVCPVTCDPPRVEQNGACVTPIPVAGCPPGKADIGGGRCEAPYVAWIGADPTEAGAKALFTALQQRHADLLAARPLDIRARQNPDRFSVRIGPAAKREAAQDLCNRLRAAGLNGKCYPEPL